jgi:hypothetical protein
MDDGSQLWFEGFLTSPDESGLNPAIVGVTGGNCNLNRYSGTLTANNERPTSYHPR